MSHEDIKYDSKMENKNEIKGVSWHPSVDDSDDESESHTSESVLSEIDKKEYVSMLRDLIISHKQLCSSFFSVLDLYRDKDDAKDDSKDDNHEENEDSDDE